VAERDSLLHIRQWSGTSLVGRLQQRLPGPAYQAAATSRYLAVEWQHRGSNITNRRALQPARGAAVPDRNRRGGSVSCAGRRAPCPCSRQVVALVNAARRTAERQGSRWVRQPGLVYAPRRAERRGYGVEL
jgi:hypothetical protein